MNDTQYSKGIAAIVFASLVWGTTGTAASLSANISAFSIGAFSMGGAGLLFIFTNLRKLLFYRKKFIENSKLVLFGGLSVAIYPLAFYSSMSFSGVAVGTIVSIASAPLFTVIFERLSGQASVSLRWWLSFVLGVAGVSLLVIGKQHDDSSALISLNNQFGVILGCIAGLTYACYTWAIKRLIGEGIESQTAMSGLFGFASFILLPATLVWGDNLFATVTNSAVSLYMVIVPMFCGYLLFSYGLKNVNASDATLITLLEPLIATLLAIGFLGERFSIVGIIGAVLLLISLLTNSIKQGKSLAYQAKKHFN